MCAVDTSNFKDRAPDWWAVGWARREEKDATERGVVVLKVFVRRVKAYRRAVAVKVARGEWRR